MAKAKPTISTQTSPKRRYHLHAPLLIYIGVSLLVAVGAFHSQNNLLFWLFGLSLGLMLVSGIISGTMMMGVRLVRVGCDDSVVGQPVRVRYRVSNTSRVMPLFALSLNEVISEGSGNAAGTKAVRLGMMLLSGEANGHVGANGKNTTNGKPALRERIARVFMPPMGFVTFVPPRGEVEIEGYAVPTDFGRLKVSAVTVSTSFPFGIIRKSLRFEGSSGCIIRPAPVEVSIALDPRGQGTLTHSLESWRQPGAGDEFFGVREYSPGDAPKTIAWKRSAWASTLLVTQTAGAAPGRVWIVLHVPQSSTQANIDAMQACAVSVIERAARLSLSVGLLLPQASIERIPKQGKAQAETLMDTLSLLSLDPASVKPQPPAAYLPARPQVGDTVVVIHAGPVRDAVGPAGSVQLSTGVTPEGTIWMAPRGREPGASTAALIAESEAA
jgi:uncharacterized protein (DUF58 family)